ncbi:hypothetical protein [Micromonospora echinofusca]|uniref:Uncharacterized protein n=1 Tax=Micromonospora echinofusca TaxID=47858 RepID=A0ABS3VXU0_MICEH|nr:hypothetical protein [Micromonospora echinofusca]MBO4209178.1 hypothetical protein [Micromonospora echinofusca]
MKLRTCALVLAAVVALVGVPDPDRLRPAPPPHPGPSVMTSAAALLIRSAVTVMINGQVTR